MVFAGMLPWFLFSTILGEASNSLVGNASLVGKVYFPRLIIPACSAVVALIDFAINLGILFGLMLWYGFWPSWQIARAPPSRPSHDGRAAGCLRGWKPSNA